MLTTRPMYLLGILSKRNEFRIILTPELDIPRKIEVNNKDNINLLLIKIKIDRLVNRINIIVNFTLL